MQKVKRTKLWLPNYVASSVLELKASELKRLGVTHLVFDIDETVVPKAYNELTEEYIAFLQGLEKQGFVILIGSNSKRDLGKIAQHLDTVVVRPTRSAFKPLKRYFKKVVAEAGVKPEKIAMIGDRVLNDIVGGNRAGLKTILVEPYARRQRWLDRLYLKQCFR